MASRFSVDDVDRFGCTSPPGYIVDQGFIQTPYVWGEIAGIGRNMLGVQGAERLVRESGVKPPEVWGLCIQRGPYGLSPWSGGLGAKPHAESFSLHK